MLDEMTLGWIGDDNSIAPSSGIQGTSPKMPRVRHRPSFLLIDVAQQLDEQQLSQIGIKSGTLLLAAAQSEEGFEHIRSALHLSARDLARWLHVCDLLRVTRLTLPMAYLLVGLGHVSVNQLAQQSPLTLYDQISQLNIRSNAERARVGRRLCEIWVGSARGLRKIKYHGDMVA